MAGPLHPTPHAPNRGPHAAGPSTGARQRQPAAPDQLGLRRRRRGTARPCPTEGGGAGAIPVPGRRCV